MEIHSNKKALEDMTLEELWRLFPIVLTPHRKQWKKWAKEEINDLSVILSEYSTIINHIGSTAIPDIMSKPIIDILVEIAPDTDRQRIKVEMEAAGYICMSSSDTRMSFNKGYTPEGYAKKVFHIHFHAFGDNDEILFRDHLNNDPTASREYEALKTNLLIRYKNDRDGYTEAKSGFIKRIIGDARKKDDSREFEKENASVIR